MYVSNRSDQHVYFDDFKVQITNGNILEENHYYSYGLKIAGISSKRITDGYDGLAKNNYLYNDKELWDEGDLNWYDYGFRNYDPQIGRFTQLDPLTDDYPTMTPYQYASCEPIANVDLDGLEALNTTKVLFSNVDEFVFTSVKKVTTQTASSGSKLWGALKTIGNVAKDFVPFASGLINIYEGIRDGNGMQALAGAGEVLFDAATFGVGSVAKGVVKTVVKQTAKFVVKQEVKQVVKAEAKAIVKKEVQVIVEKVTKKVDNTLKNQRQKAVRNAWKQEKALVKETGEGTVQWTEKQAKELLEKGKVKGYQGHHINNVKHHPQHAGNPNNIKFVTPKEHLKAHGGNFKNKSTGTFINRKLD